jgi:hypothetical protein
VIYLFLFGDNGFVDVIPTGLDDLQQNLDHNHVDIFGHVSVDESLQRGVGGC